MLNKTTTTYRAFLTMFLIGFSILVSSAVAQTEMPHIVLTPSASNTYQIIGHMNKKPVVFIIDTGASGLAFSSDTAKYLSTPPCHGSYKTSTANGVVDGCKTRVQELNFGPFVLNNVPAGVVPNMEQGTVLLGMSVLQNFNIGISNRKMTVAAHSTELVNPNYQPSTNWFSPKNEVENTFMYTLKKIAGIAFVVILLTYAIGGLVKALQVLRK